MAELHLNPYAGVDWSAVERHKAQLHAHTWHPPPGHHSGTDPPEVVVDDYRAAGYSVLALTDHEYNVEAPTWPWSDFDRDPEALDVVAVCGVELAVELGEGDEPLDGDDGPAEHDLLSLFCALAETAGLGFHGALAEVGERGGLAVVPHPSRYAEDGAWYEPYFRAHPHLLGVEVVNAADRYPTDRDVWDDLQGRLGADRPVWGFANDDYHGRSMEYAFDRSRNVLLLEERSGDAVREALTRGRFLYQHVVEADLGDGRDRGDDDRPAGRDAPPHPPVEAEPPVVEAIRHDPDSGEVTVEARNHDVIQWASAGDVVARGPTLRYREVDGLGSYARARLVAPSGSETGTQPFLFR